MDEICVMTLLFEGDEDEVGTNEKKVFGIAKRYGGLSAGALNGERGYMFTFVIAYIRVSWFPLNRSNFNFFFK